MNYFMRLQAESPNGVWVSEIEFTSQEEAEEWVSVHLPDVGWVKE